MQKQKITTILTALILFSSSSHAFALAAHVQRDTYGCKSKDDMDALSNYRVQGDKAAFQKAYIAGMMSGACAQFNGGEAVSIEGGGILSSGLYQIRREGDTEEYWVEMETVK